MELTFEQTQSTERGRYTPGKPLRTIFVGVALGASTVLVIVAAIVALYIVKSSMGINLFEGRSILHDILFRFVI